MKDGIIKLDFDLCPDNHEISIRELKYYLENTSIKYNSQSNFFEIEGKSASNVANRFENVKDKVYVVIIKI